MAARFKIGSRYKGKLIGGSKKCNAVFEYVGNKYFKLLNMHPLLTHYCINSCVHLVTEEGGESAYWDLKPFVVTLENK